MTYLYRALGLDLVSEFPCPDFAPAEGASTGREISLTLGPVPDALAEPVRDRPLLQIAADGAALHHVPGVARYLLEKRSRVTIDLAPGAALDRALDFFSQTPLAMLCHQWGLVPLRAACVSRKGQGVLLATASSSGKSTMAMALLRHGFDFVSDDLCALDAGPDGALRLWPHRPRARLWPDSLKALGMDEPEAARTPSGRITLSGVAPFFAAPVAPSALVMMFAARGGVALHESAQKGIGAFEKVMNMQALPEATRGLFDNPGRLKLMAGLTSRLRVAEVWHPAEFSRLDESVARALAALPEALRAETAA